MGRRELEVLLGVFYVRLLSSSDVIPWASFLSLGMGGGMIEVIAAFLWRMGGSGYPGLRRNWRRIGVPVLLVSVCLLRWISPLIAILMGLCLHMATRLPLTFFGESLHDHWFNWVWVWIAGYILGLPSVLLHGWNGVLLALIPMVAQGLSVNLSNVSGWPAKTFTHEFCESVTGVAVALAVLH